MSSISQLAPTAYCGFQLESVPFPRPGSPYIAYPSVPGAGCLGDFGNNYLLTASRIEVRGREPACDVVSSYTQSAEYCTLSISHWFKLPLREGRTTSDRFVVSLYVSTALHSCDLKHTE